MEKIIAYFNNKNDAQASADWFKIHGVAAGDVTIHRGVLDGEVLSQFSEVAAAIALHSEDYSLVVEFENAVSTARACSFLKHSGAYLIDITERTELSMPRAMEM